MSRNSANKFSGHHERAVGHVDDDDDDDGDSDDDDEDAAGSKVKPLVFMRHTPVVTLRLFLRDSLKQRWCMSFLYPANFDADIWPSRRWEDGGPTLEGCFKAPRILLQCGRPACLLGILEPS